MIHKMMSYYEKQNEALKVEIDLLEANMVYFRNLASGQVSTANTIRKGAASPAFKKQYVKQSFSRAAYSNIVANRYAKRKESLIEKVQENNRKIEELNERTYRPYC